MSHHYSDPARKNDTYALPDLETFKNQYQQCDHCSALNLRTMGDWDTCPQCERAEFTTSKGWFYWFCFPGCMPEGDPIGPFKTEREALASAREES